jgi:choline-sulfatase
VTRTLVRVLVSIAAIGGAAFWFTSRPQSPDGQHPGEVRRPPQHLLLITIDTLRADRVGAYGWANARTSTLDALARRGIRFTHAYATAPITLTSHATMLTGRYPPGHGARHNGMAIRTDVPTLAEHLARAGFSTAAFVSAFPLDKRFGLGRGFATYDDELPRGADGRPLNERPGSVTVDRALAWVRAQRADARLFAWVHLFEPHAPYGTPSRGAARPRQTSERYDDEVATADAQIGRLLGSWPDREQTLVVATADHGEAFGEHGEIGHSIFVYDTTLHVPLIVAGPFAPAAAVVDDPVTLADLAPTMLPWLGLPPLDADGIDVSPAIGGGGLGHRVLYAESFAPLLDFGWAPLRSLRGDGFKLIAAPRSELYDLRTDRGEEHNVIDARADLGRDLTTRVDRISPPDLPSHAEAPDPEALARLRALGYAGGGPTSSGARPDPKDRIGVASRIAAVTSGELQGPEVERALNEVLREDPGNTQAHLRLGYVLAESGRCAAAERHFAAAIAAGLASADAHLGLAMCEAQRGAAAAALATLRDARRVEPGNPVVEANIGLAELEAGRPETAIDPLRAALRSDPSLHQARFALARALARTGQREAARAEASDLLARLPASAPQRAEVERLLAALRETP